MLLYFECDHNFIQLCSGQIRKFDLKISQIKKRGKKKRQKRFTFPWLTFFWGSWVLKQALNFMLQYKRLATNGSTSLAKISNNELFNPDICADCMRRTRAKTRSCMCCAICDGRCKISCKM